VPLSLKKTATAKIEAYLIETNCYRIWKQKSEQAWPHIQIIRIRSTKALNFGWLRVEMATRRAQRLDWSIRRRASCFLSSTLPTFRFRSSWVLCVRRSYRRSATSSSKVSRLSRLKLYRECVTTWRFSARWWITRLLWSSHIRRKFETIWQSFFQRRISFPMLITVIAGRNDPIRSFTESRILMSVVVGMRTRPLTINCCSISSMSTCAYTVNMGLICRWKHYLGISYLQKNN
jgi:hypothetical protein